MDEPEFGERKDDRRVNLRARCPYCEAVLDAAAATFSRKSKPSQGDVSICIYCAQVLVFTKDLRLRKPKPNEIVETPELRLMQAAVRSLDRRHRRRT